MRNSKVLSPACKPPLLLFLFPFFREGWTPYSSDMNVSRLLNVRNPCNLHMGQNMVQVDTLVASKWIPTVAPLLMWFTVMVWMVAPFNPASHGHVCEGSSDILVPTGTPHYLLLEAKSSHHFPQQNPTPQTLASFHMSWGFSYFIKLLPALKGLWGEGSSGLNLVPTHARLTYSVFQKQRVADL